MSRFYGFGVRSCNRAFLQSYLLEVSRYVLLNPVRAGACAAPEDWAWSSFHATGGLGRELALLTTDWLLAQFADDRHEAQKRYRSFVHDGIGSPAVLTAFGV